MKCFWEGMAPIPVRPAAQLSLAQQVRIKQAPAGPVRRGQNREDAELTLPAPIAGPAPPPCPPPSIPHSLPRSPNPHQQRQTPRAHGEGTHRQYVWTAHQPALTLLCSEALRCWVPPPALRGSGRLNLLSRVPSVRAAAIFVEGTRLRAPAGIES